MADINLLPEELREKEKKELETAGKQGQASVMKMSQPVAEPSLPAKAVPPKQPFWGRVFVGKNKPAKPKPAPVVKAAPVRRETKPALEPTIAPDFLAASPVVAQTSTNGRPQPGARNGSSVESPRPSVVKARPLPPPPPAPASSQAQPKPAFGLFGRRPHPAKERTRQSATAVTTPVAETPADRSGLDVNLIPEGLANQKEQNFARRLVRSGILVVLTLAVVGLAYAGIVWYKLMINRQVEETTAQVNQLEGQIAAIQADTERATSLQQRLELIRDLLDRHQYWTKLFAVLEEHTINDVYYTNFSMAGTEKVVLTAVGKDYQSVARQLVAFQAATDVITDVEINSALANLDDLGNYQDVNFTINLTLNPDVFRRPIR